MNCRPCDGNDFPSRELQLIMQRFFAQEPQVREYSLLGLGLTRTLTLKQWIDIRAIN